MITKQGLLISLVMSLCVSGYAEESRDLLEKVRPGLLSMGRRGVPYINEELQAEILEMAREDQRVRNLCSADQDGEKIIQIDQAHLPRLKEIISEFGWPGISLVGLAGSSAFCLLIQHQDTDLDFQQECLSLLKEAVEKQEAAYRDYVYLLNRVGLNEGSP